MDIIKTYSYHQSAQDKIAKENLAIAEKEKHLQRSQLWIYGVTGCVQIFKAVFILTVGVYLIYIQRIRVGELLAAIQLAEMMAAPIEVLAYLLNGRNETKPLVKQYKEIIEKTEPDGTKKLGRIEKIDVRQVSYQIGEVRILNPVSFSLKKGRNYLMTGESGSGKSTLLKLLGKVVDATDKGELYVNDIPYREVRKAPFYEKVAYVSQESYLFWLPLEENILLGREDLKANYRQVMDRLNLNYLVERFANQSLNEEMVSKLSGGEKQRIALARAMIGKPEIYLLDEVTSSLDDKNAYEIEKMLLDEKAMVIHVCHKVIPKLREHYDEIIRLG